MREETCPMPTTPATLQTSPTFRTFNLRNMDDIPGIDRLSPEGREAVQVVGSVLPFKTNNYVCEQLIDWDAVPDDPMFQLTFPQRGMLSDDDYQTVADLVRAGAPREQVKAAAETIQRRLNPHPSGQATDNVPMLDGEPIPGIQHKYRETVLFFPSQSQTCHAYCTYCFRWPQFVNLDGLRFASKETNSLAAYLRAKPEVSDILFTGGDPLVMRTPVLERYIEPLLAPEFEGRRIRIGSKAPVYWPYRFTDGEDADALLRLFERIVAAGRHLAIMVHYSHPNQLDTDVARNALRRILSTGAVVRCQAPLIRHVNDSVEALTRLWRTEVDLGAVPYYMFVERDTGARHYFEVPLARALDLYTEAFQAQSGLGRTVRGPVMSAQPGKVLIDGVIDLGDRKAFVCKMLQSRDPEQANEIFLAEYDEQATWYDDLKRISLTPSAPAADELVLA
jgi:KamA family protein